MESLLVTFKVAEDVQRFAVCPHCVAAGVAEEMQNVFDIVSLISTFQKDQRTVLCGTATVALANLAPDICLDHVEVLPNNASNKVFLSSSSSSSSSS